MQLAQSFSAISEEHYSETAGGQIEAPAGKRQIMRICLTRGKVCEPTLTSALVGDFEKLSAEIKSRDVFHAPSAGLAERRLKECGEILEDFADRVYEAGGTP